MGELGEFPLTDFLESIFIFYFVSQHLLTYIFMLSVLKTFLHDPLVEWSKQSKGLLKAQANETGEIVNEKVCAFLHFL